MSELMTPIPFRELMTWITTEYRRDGAVFGVHKPYKAGVKKLPIFGEAIETPFGPAAGPNTQLAQNIIAGYFAGARFFELKTVQKMDGADLAACINRPCILAEDECYNCEWSTELYVQQAFEEYVKAWCALKIMAKVYGLGDPNGFVFNMSVGYDLAGIQGEKIDTFLNGMVDASKTPIFQECIAVLKEFFPGESDYIDTITPHVSGSVTVSTLHGCPPDEIERIASYLLEKKHLHTFVKCNPTILGYETARSILDSMGYDYIAFDDHHFKEDLQYADAVPMFHRLQALADKEGLEFGLKLSNTFPVDVKAGELPSEEMYMAGKSLFPLTTTMAAMMAKEFGGKLRLSYAGGADAFNIDKLFACGIWPITMATTELKPGGYQRFTQIGDKLDALDFKPFTGVDVVGIEALSLAARSDKYHVKAIKPLPRRKLYDKVPLLDCFTAPCKGGCPIHQDIPEYIELCRKGAYASALRLITEKNPLPFITGTICAHNCMTKCMRNYYDEPVNIRATKLVAAEKGYDAYMSKITPPAPVTDGRKVAVIGGGHGLSNMLRGLKQYTENISAIVTVADDGGGSGMLRQDLGMPPPGDIRSCMEALANTEPVMRELLHYRFTEGSLAGQSFGNLFLAALNGISPSFDAAVRRMSQVLAITGRVLPVTTADVQLEAEFENGATVVGESKIFYCKKQEDCRIRQVRLIPSRPKALPEAVSAIADADMIVLGPGSLYTSIIPNLLVDGIVKAIRESDALKVYVCNVMTQEGETEGYTVSDHIAAIFAHSAQGLFRLCLTNSSPIPKAVAARYAEEGAERIRCDKSACAALGVEVVERPVATVESGFVRHSSAALARELILLHAERSVRIAGARFRPREDSYQMEEQK